MASFSLISINEQTGSLPPRELRDYPCKQKQQQVQTLCVCSPQAKSRQPVATHCSSISAHLYPNNNYCLTARPTLTACLLNNGIVKRRSADLFVTPPPPKSLWVNDMALLHLCTGLLMTQLRQHYRSLPVIVWRAFSTKVLILPLYQFLLLLLCLRGEPLAVNGCRHY